MPIQKTKVAPSRPLSGFGHWVWHAATDSVELDKGAQALFGQTKDSEPLSVWREAAHPQERQAHDLALDDCLQGRAPSFECLYRVRRQNDSWFWVFERGWATKTDSNGRAVEITAACLETSRLEATETLSADVQRIAQIGGWELDLKTGRTVWTAETYRIHGLAVGSPTDKKMGIDFYSPEERDRLVDAISDCAKGNSSVGIYEFTDATGIRKWVQVTIEPIINADRTIPKLRGTLQDVTRAKLAELELNKRNEFIKATFAQSNDAMMILEPPTSRFTSANAAALALFGATDEAAVVQRHPREVSPEFQADGERSDIKARRMIETALRDGRAFFEWDHCRLDGTVIPCTVLLSRISFLEEPVLQATVRDVTELKQKEVEIERMTQALVTEKTRLENMIKNTPGATYRFHAPSDAEPMFSFISEQACEIYGCSPDDLLRDPRFILSRLHPEEEESLQNAIKKSAEEMKQFDWEGRILRMSGEVRWIRAASIPYDDGKGGIVWDGLLFDITSERAAAQIVAQERLRAIQASNLKSLAEMSAGLAHEINNPLTIVAGNVRLLWKHRDNEERFSAGLDVINNSIGRISKIVGGLSRFARINATAQTERRTLSSIVNDAWTIARAEAKRLEVAVEFELESTSELLCDAIELEQATTNLLLNAIYAAKDSNSRWVKAHVFDLSEEIVLRVLDSGPGVAPSIEDKLYEPFFTTKPVGEGTGLGLSICKGIVERHGGALGLNRTFDSTCFEVRLRRAPSADAQDFLSSGDSRA